MDLNPARCYQAILSRDRRFDGRFFTGVVTTGIYCRPVCPVAPPKFQNMRFFACAAAAETAGFRPCKRCRPETAPGTPAWVGTSAVVTRALRLISEGALDDGNVGTLADRLGIGARQLRRLFAQHLGASPTDMARARRVHFARSLIDDTNLRITEVALAAGFSSIRQFNHAIRGTFGASPTALRQRRAPHRAPAKLGGVVVRLAYRPPLAWAPMLRFLRMRAIPGVEVVADGTYSRTIEVNGMAGRIAAWPDGDAPALLVRIELPRHDSLIEVVERVRRLFDLDADPLRISEQLYQSPQLTPLIEALPGVRVPGAWDPFELAVRAILGQQVTVRGATTLAGRLVHLFGTPIDHDGDGMTHLFPHPETLADADLRRIGLPRARAATIRTLAATVARGGLAFDASSDVEDMVTRLCAIDGMGPWTAHYIAMRGLGQPDAFPSTDLGLRRALGNGQAPVPAAAVARLAEAWRPWRAYAAMYLWLGDTETTQTLKEAS
ncbi:MAG TPA: AlkA N-terminal domain-containing protein [Candidatus Margulisiibacteriota bacterium]|nr:AlkA N-terminal domain-containing protein [Candidatus Margulisiibacteriota bacterium]